MKKVHDIKKKLNRLFVTAKKEPFKQNSFDRINGT